MSKHCQAFISAARSRIIINDRFQITNLKRSCGKNFSEQHVEFRLLLRPAKQGAGGRCLFGTMWVAGRAHQGQHKTAESEKPTGEIWLFSGAGTEAQKWNCSDWKSNFHCSLPGMVLVLDTCREKISSSHYIFLSRPLTISGSIHHRRKWIHRLETFGVIPLN